MKIAFTGKGGSGKTTISSLFVMYLAHVERRVLALDADINQHLAEALGFKGELRSMGREADTIKRHLAGTNPLFTSAVMHKTTPPGHGSQLLTLEENDWFIKEFTSWFNGVHIGGAGTIPEGNVGVKCYHGLNGAVELVLGHMIDRASDVVVVDMTAGADAFSSSLFTKVDALVLVVEPTLKSLSVYDQFRLHADMYGIPLVVVGNKVETGDDEQFIEEHVGKLAVCFGPSLYVRGRERGRDADFTLVEHEIREGLEQLLTELSVYERDWDVVELRSHQMHTKNIPLLPGAFPTAHIDTSFSLKRAAEDLL